MAENVLHLILLHSPKILRNLINNSFANRGLSVFNSLPSYLPNLKWVPLNVFKIKLEKFLRDIPDESGNPQFMYVKFRAACSNSLIDQIPYERRSNWHESVDSWKVVVTQDEAALEN